MELSALAFIVIGFIGGGLFTVIIAVMMLQVLSQLMASGPTTARITRNFTSKDQRNDTGCSFGKACKTHRHELGQRQKSNSDLCSCDECRHNGTRELALKYLMADDYRNRSWGPIA